MQDDALTAGLPGRRDRLEPDGDRAPTHFLVLLPHEARFACRSNLGQQIRALADQSRLQGHDTPRFPADRDVLHVWRDGRPMSCQVSQKM